MATFKKFEEIEAWQKSRALSKTIFAETRQGMFARDFRLRDQINASCGSVMDNIAEGFERDGTKEFIQFLSMAKGSAGELRSQLYRCFDRSYIDQEKFDGFSKEIISITNMISGLIRYLKTTELKGKKYKKKPLKPKSDNL